MACFYGGYRFKSIDLKTDKEIEQKWEKAYSKLQDKYSDLQDRYTQELIHTTKLLKEQIAKPRFKIPEPNMN